MQASLSKGGKQRGAGPGNSCIQSTSAQNFQGLSLKQRWFFLQAFKHNLHMLLRPHRRKAKSKAIAKRPVHIAKIQNGKCRHRVPNLPNVDER